MIIRKIFAFLLIAPCFMATWIQTSEAAPIAITAVWADQNQPPTAVAYATVVMDQSLLSLAQRRIGTTAEVGINDIFVTTITPHEGARTYHAEHVEWIFMDWADSLYLTENMIKQPVFQDFSFGIAGGTGPVGIDRRTIQLPGHSHPLQLISFEVAGGLVSLPMSEPRRDQVYGGLHASQTPQLTAQHPQPSAGSWPLSAPTGFQVKQ